MKQLLIFFSGPFSLKACKKAETSEIETTQGEEQLHRRGRKEGGVPSRRDPSCLECSNAQPNSAIPLACTRSREIHSKEIEKGKQNKSVSPPPKPRSMKGKISGQSEERRNREIIT